tara:strand:- start:23 stop:571 length:549 start_codon:yes stop_codon:yes gene_type:complete
MAFKMKGNPMSRNFGIGASSLKMGDESTPAVKMKKDDSSMKLSDKKAKRMAKKDSKLRDKSFNTTKESKAKKLEAKRRKLAKGFKGVAAEMMEERIAYPMSSMKLSEADKKKAMKNAMPAAEKVSMSKATMAGAKKYGFMDGGSFNKDKAQLELRKLSKMTGQTESNRAKQAEIRKLMKAFS